MTLPRLRAASGFTLMEMLIAVLVFAMVGLISAQLLSRTLDSQSVIRERGDRLTDVHRAMQILQRDLMQLSNRPIREGYGSVVGPLLIGTDGAIEFTRVGWRNPLQTPRAEVQRVGYSLVDGELLRGYWRIADRAQDAEPAFQTLLTDVERIEFFALDISGNEHAFWPIAGGGTAATALAGVILRIEVAPFGVIERVWQVPSV